jgi:hypothetical protein
MLKLRFYFLPFVVLMVRNRVVSLYLELRDGIFLHKVQVGVENSDFVLEIDCNCEKYYTFYGIADEHGLLPDAELDYVGPGVLKVPGLVETTSGFLVF